MKLLNQLRWLSLLLVLLLSACMERSAASGKVSPVVTDSATLPSTEAFAPSPSPSPSNSAARPVSHTPRITPTAPSASTRSPGWRRPPLQASWQWQLGSGPIDPAYPAEVYDIHLFENDAAAVKALHARGSLVICYLSAGSWENWRPDHDQFPNELIGSDYTGWPGEKWLDIRQIDRLAPVLRARLDLCKSKGFDGVEPDNIDGYANETGFALNAADQIRFNRWLAGEAHQRGLSIGLKNDQAQVRELWADFDWALTEDCFSEGWCDQMLPFVQAGKPVFAAEYTDTGITRAQFCPQAATLGLNAILKHRELDAWRQTCP